MTTNQIKEKDIDIKIYSKEYKDGRKKINDNKNTKQITKEEEKKGGYTVNQMSNRIIEKEAIAMYVANEIIKDGMSIFLDAGSTVYKVGFMLFDKLNRSGLTIMTNNMLVFNEFTKRNVVMFKRGNVLALTGGSYTQNHEALFGVTAVTALEKFYPRVVIIGTSGLMVKETNSHEKHPPQGVFYHDVAGSEVVTKEAIASMSTSHRVIVCDYSKIGVSDSSCFASINELAKHTEQCTIVTNNVPPDLDKNERKHFEKRFIETYNAIKNLGLENVKMIRVNSNGMRSE